MIRFAYWTGTLWTACAAVRRLETRVDLGQQGVRQTGHDTDHDDERNAVPDTLVGDLLSEPHDEHGAGDQDHRGVDHEPERVAVDERRGRQCMEQVSDIRRSLDCEDDNREEACPLIHFAAPALALLLHLLEVGNHDSHQLDDDRSGDVGHYSECENGGIAKCTAGEYVQQAEQAVVAHLVGQCRPLAQGVGVDTRNNHKTAQAIYEKEAQRVENTFAQLLDLVYVLEGFD